MDNHQHCPCGTNKDFARCCKPFIVGDTCANSPETLMRSRYSAYATKQYSYIVDTQAPEPMAALQAIQLNPSDADHIKSKAIAEVESASKNTLWCKLEVLSAFELDDKGEVEFVAYYKAGNEFFTMHERSRFIHVQGKWFYENGDMLHKSGIVKPSRNDSCLCGSGKKFKRCCLIADT